MADNLLRIVKNVGDTERLASGLAGAALLVLGAARRRPEGYAAAILGAALVYRALSGNCKLYQAFDMDTRTASHGAVSVPGNRGVKVERTVLVNRPVADVFAAWRDLENLPNFMTHLEAVTAINSVRSFWTARGPAGMHVSWEAEIINEKPNEMLSWRSLHGSDVSNAGTVRFRSVGDGTTELRVTLEYDVVAGRLGNLVARLFHRDPDKEIAEDLERFKEQMEAHV